MDANTLRDEIDSFDEIQNEIQVERQTTDIICIFVDTTKVRGRIQELILEAQKEMFEQIKAKATVILEGQYTLFEDSRRELSTDPKDLHHLKRVRDKWRELTERKSKIEDQITPLEEVFKLLDENQVQMNREETKKRQELREKYEEFSTMLDKVKVRNDNFFTTMRNTHNEQLSDFNKEIKEKKTEDFDKNAPFSLSKGENVESTESAMRKIDAYKDRTDEFREQEAKMQFGF